MRIHWGRILLAAFVAEALLVAVFQIASQRFGNLSGGVVVFLGGFAFMFVGAQWVARKIDSRFLLHGTLVGIAAVLFYTIITLYLTVGGQFRIDYNIRFFLAHIVKILGGAVGSFLAGRRGKRP
jgi:putative membrane protein (TIGR04086 family)